MSIIAIAALLLTIASNKFCITICVRALSRVPIRGSARMPSQRRTTGVEISSNSCCCRRMISSRPFTKALVVSSPSLSISMVARHVSSANPCASFPNSFRMRSNNGCLKENTNIAVSPGVKPSSTRRRDRLVRNSMTLCHSGRDRSVKLPPATARRSPLRNVRALVF